MQTNGPAGPAQLYGLTSVIPAAQTVPLTLFHADQTATISASLIASHSLAVGTNGCMHMQIYAAKWPLMGTEWLSGNEVTISHNWRLATLYQCAKQC